MPYRRPSRSALLLFLLLAPLAACGDGGEGGDAGPPEVLFSGPAGELVPHAVGRSAAYRVTATGEGMSDESGFTSTVVAEPGDGTFVTRFVSATGAIAESTSRDTGSEVRVERFVSDPGGAEEKVVELEPPVVVVRTPVVAGEAIESSFARTLELVITVRDTVLRRQVLFTGSGRRVPEAREPVTVPGGTFDALRYAVSARGEVTIPVVGQAILLTVDVAGAEWFAPGVGGVKEDLELVLGADGERTTVRLVTERLADGAEPGGS